MLLVELPLFMRQGLGFNIKEVSMLGCFLRFFAQFFYLFLSERFTVSRAIFMQLAIFDFLQSPFGLFCWKGCFKDRSRKENFHGYR